MRTLTLATAVALSATTLAAPLTSTAAPQRPHHPSRAGSQHVLLLSVDGMHQSDLEAYAATHPRSALARLVRRGTSYTDASTTFPSDSFPGMIGQLTGAGPATTGVYYDDTWDRAMLPAGTVDCKGTARGAEVAWTEGADISQDPLMLDAGQGLAGLSSLTTATKAETLAHAQALTTAVLHMTGNPTSLLNPAALPVSPKTCRPVLPHQVLRTNTVFEVAKAHGLRTAWSDKHPAYEILDGPSGSGIDDLFTPEINSVADKAGDDWTSDNLLTQEYDSFKVAGVLNEIRGYDHSGERKVGVPAVFGMNFQTVSTAEKLPTSDGLKGGYNADGTPGPLLSKALDYIDAQVGAMQKAIDEQHLGSSTTIVLSAKHGNAPMDTASLRRVDDGAIVDAINKAWADCHPGCPKLVAFSVDDDLMMLWLSDRSPAAESFVARYLKSHTAPANTINDPKGTYSTTVPSSGLAVIRTGAGARALFGAHAGDPSTPDVVGIARHGVVYTGGVKKISEHGGADPEDMHVPLVVAGPGTHGRTIGAPVETTQIAPTILQLLGLDPRALSGARAEHTQVLPGIGRRHH